jgi:hypothetical protein
VVRTAHHLCSHFRARRPTADALRSCTLRAYISLPAFDFIQIMAPTRRVKTARAASQRPPFPPTPSGSEEYSDHDMDPDATYNPSNTHPRASPYQRHSQGAYPLQRGTACLSCRKRKMVRVLVSLDSYPIIRLLVWSSLVDWTIFSEMRWVQACMPTMYQGKSCRRL